jgi:hypothetical protein
VMFAAALSIPKMSLRSKMVLLYYRVRISKIEWEDGAYGKRRDVEA